MTTSDANGDATRRRFDWDAAYRRFESIQQALEAAEHPDPQQVAAVLRERARQYAKHAADAGGEAMLEVIAIEVEGERFAIEIGGGAAATSLSGLTEVPGLPPYYLGLIGHRGQVFPVIDVRTLMGRPRGEGKALRYAVLTRSGRGALGLAASEILGIRQYPASRIAAVRDEASRHHALIGIGPDSTAIFDTARLLQDNRLLVDDQPGIAARNEGDGL
ncbi:MAG TPA: chemotaxis protein CheW [Dongiaceae bacterium]|jgi:purine-binding chemotaxis protein CheW|nr:chemotaxis protein CheW [Dongiaceae bacterium]